jgi:hypothetical protein
MRRKYFGTHLIPACIDHGFSEVHGANLLAAMGICDLIGTTLSGWLSDRFSNRSLLLASWRSLYPRLYKSPVHSLAFVFHRSEKGASAADVVCKLVIASRANNQSRAPARRQQHRDLCASATPAQEANHIQTHNLSCHNLLVLVRICL